MSSNGKWTTGDIPDQRGRVAIVTGANTGLGYHTAAALAQAGAQVILAVRDLEKGNLALARIVAAQPDANVTLQELDLSSLASVRAAELGGVLLHRAQTRMGLAGVDQRRLGALDAVGINRRLRRDAGEMLQDVERRALGGQTCLWNVIGSSGEVLEPVLTTGRAPRTASPHPSRPRWPARRR